MREIKFRAWEKNLKEIIPVYNINFKNKMINSDTAWRLFDEIILMQYTGLKDKKGIGIYEGDIVTSEFVITKQKWPEYSSDIYLKSKPKFEVNFIDGGFKLKTLYNYDEYFHKSSVGLTEFIWFLEPLMDGRTHEYSDFEKEFSLRTHYTLINLEVIGNIYENPELIVKGG